MDEDRHVCIWMEGMSFDQKSSKLYRVSKNIQNTKNEKKHKPYSYIVMKLKYENKKKMQFANKDR